MNDILDPIIIDKPALNGEKLFSDAYLRQARKLLMLSRLSISFVKETDKYIIVSGIVRENRSHEAKIVYRFHANHTDGVLSSNCDCSQWTKEDHCAHTASLFIYHFFAQQTSGQTDLSKARSEAINVYHGLNQNMSNTNSDAEIKQMGAVTPLDFGTVVNGPSKLQGAPPSATYSTLQYVLTSKKAVPFPVPKNWEGRLQMHYNYQVTDPDNHSLGTAVPELFFSYVRVPSEADSAGVAEKEISIFENLYLFNWKTGETWHFPNELKDIIQKLRHLNFDIGVNQLIWFTTLPGFSDYCDLILQGKKLDEHEIAKITPAISINAADKNTLDFELSFIDENKKLYYPPELFSALVFEDGLLGSFKKKKDAYGFILHLNDIFNGENNLTFRTNTFDRLRRDWPIYLQYLMAPGAHYEFDLFNQCFVRIEKDLLIDLFKAMISAFNDTIFRFSSFHKEQLKLVYNIQTGIAFQNLRSFIEKVQIRGVSVYFDRREIGQWHSRIRFERRSSTTKWFELDVTLNASDYAILKSVDKQTGMAMSETGLILLNSDQLNLAKMLSRVLETNKTQNAEAEGDAKRDLREYRFSIPYNRARIIEIFELKKIGIAGLLTEEEENLCHKLLNLKEMPKYDVPATLGDVLRPYQLVGYNWLRFLYEHKLGACLADDMGLGKTIQVIALLKSIESSIKRVLIVCPVTILINWQKEFEKFSDLKTLIYHGGQRQLPPDIKFIITSYGVMKKEADTTFKDVQFDIFILDEVQHLKNMRSLGAWSARKISAEFRICLTGTPVENDLAEFYNIIDLAIPGIWGDLQILRTISTDITRERARTTAGPFILRRTKGQVLTDLPAKIENNVYLQFSDEERATYLQGLLDIKARIESAASKRKYGEILRGLLRLRQSCLWQGKQLQPGQVPKNLKDLQSTKIKFLLDQLEQIIEEGHKAIVFSQFTTYLDIIQYFLREKHYRVSRIDGSQQLKARQQQVDLFQEGNSQVFLISLKAGGVGLNLTAASYVFVMDPWWNPAVEAQAVDRAHRIGQKNTLTVYRPIMKDTVEEKVLKLQEVKKQLFLDLLPDNDEKIFSGRLSMEDFIQLFN
ncbi:MAG: hypothetical protein A2X86_12135 [Bdellovibrionales bacterium GWA2_49_15]|nr:MAG: hypothetical protein A2X86_12135 [Bdellovibrionales bacterium GWA2_49_15]